jgi:hypothetical protein
VAWSPDALATSARSIAYSDDHTCLVSAREREVERPQDLGQLTPPRGQTAQLRSQLTAHVGQATTGSWTAGAWQIGSAIETAWPPHVARLSYCQSAPLKSDGLFGSFQTSQ